MLLFCRFTVRNSASGIGFELKFESYSPSIKSIEVLELARRRRAKLYYLRDRPVKVRGPRFGIIVYCLRCCFTMPGCGGQFNHDDLSQPLGWSFQLPLAPLSLPKTTTGFRAAPIIDIGIDIAPLCVVATRLRPSPYRNIYLFLLSSAPLPPPIRSSLSSPPRLAVTACTGVYHQHAVPAGTGTARAHTREEGCPPQAEAAAQGQVAVQDDVRCGLCIGVWWLAGVQEFRNACDCHPVPRVRVWRD